MALAKYREDITERWLENTQARYEDRLKELFERFPAPVSHAGEVYLTRQGRRMEDVEVCELGQELCLGVVVSDGTAYPALEVEVGGRWQNVDFRGSETISFAMPNRGQQQFRLTSAGYLKEYTLHVIEALRIEEQNDFATFIRQLSDNPPRWTEASFAAFRSQLQSILDQHRAPSLFVSGVVEYHMGLFHEDQRHPAFRERFQSAYGHLRWFIPYSDIARLICTHFLYCANEFAAALEVCGSSAGRFNRSLNFMLGRPRTAIHDAGRPGLPLLVSLADSLLFQAVEAVQEERFDDALSLCVATGRQLVPTFDRERSERLNYVEACARAGCGEVEGARNRLDLLTESPWPSIAQAAKRKLSQLSNV